MENIKGLQLSREYYERFGAPMLERDFPEYRDRIAVGLVGHGSECFGYDDEISRDHDFFPRFRMYLTDDDYDRIGARLALAYDSLPKEYRGVKLEAKTEGLDSVKPVLRISEHYRDYTGSAGAPESAAQWLSIPLYYLAEATNGEVFADPLGEFTRIREQIRYGMPDDVRIKRIAGTLFAAAQSGQYNYSRCMRHGESGAALLALARFAEKYAQLVCMLDGVHPPYYKWLMRAARAVPRLGRYAAELDTLPALHVSDSARCAEKIDELCAAVASELVRRGLCPPIGDFLEPYAFEINKLIGDREIRELSVIAADV